MSGSHTLTLTTLLNSLHTHLQTQTQLLPTLHAQLGLPASALEDELQALQEQLMRGVEAQIEERQKEVEGWMERCETVEVDCVQYSKALGGNAKATGSSLGELRKEKVLPMRFEMVTEYQEKLRQLYHTKLEQLNVLGGRLKAISRILGPDFFSSDIVDDGEFQDVSPDRFLKLEKELARGKAEVTKRLAQLTETFIQIDWLYTELGMGPPIADESASSRAISRSRSSGSNLDDPFVSPTDAEAFHYRVLSGFIEQAVTLPQDTPPRLDVDPTPTLVSWATDLRAALEDTKRRREAHIQAMYDQLEGLWKRLGIAESDMDAFVEHHRGSTEDTVLEYEEELERMLELKRDRMGTFVLSAREEVEKLWDELMVGEAERSDWHPFYDDEHTEDLLTVHEDEIRRLKEEKRIKAPLLASIRRYFDICEEEKELAASASDQSRLLGRGARDPGRLLREEKMRKRVSKEKPRLEQDLMASVPSWEEENDRPFLVHGQSILQILMQRVGASDQENVGPGRRKPSPGMRATSAPARATTPTHSYAPKSGGVVTPAVRHAPASGNSLPSKRQRTEVTPGYKPPTVLGAHRGLNNNRSTSPTKIPTNRSAGRSTGPPTGIAKPGAGMHAQYQALGHGRQPTTGFGRSTSLNVSTSASASYASAGRYASGSQAAYNPAVLATKAARARRESFRPRASIDAEIQRDLNGASKWGFPGTTVEEADEDC
ncbi:unnamed protein product [Mycena citricolor]|uniref:Microtubule associated protein n=1 Tax=Mycena citricolor TaxID=2018698 RepID=A0AAD2Q0X3_9AGAR|nr:unnamed protein product [Mycena citricolor]